MDRYTQGDRDPWHYVTEGQVQRALDLYALIPPDKVTGIILNNRAKAYLCVRDYEAAARDFTSVIQRDPQSGSGYSGLAVCRWCQRRPDEAVSMWRDGLRAIYTDAAGVSIPARLFYAGVRLQDTQVVREAKGLLRNRLRRKTSSDWPGAVAPFVLGKLTETDFEHAARAGVTSDTLLQRHLCQYNFYCGVRAALLDDQVAFARRMRACAASGYGYLEHEYYLATWEVDQGFPEL